MRKYRLAIILSVLLCQAMIGQDQLYRKGLVDILHYQFSVSLFDTTDRIQGETKIELKVLEDADQLMLDLVGVNMEGTGMSVTKVKVDDESQSGMHVNDLLKIPYNWQTGRIYTVSITYEGIPRNGLIIGQTKYGRRSFFADHWPDRAHHWLPCIDHPSDKATCEFLVEAPYQYEVIATGDKVEESIIGEGRKLTHYRNDRPMPMKVTVIGVAEFAMQHAGEVYGHPVTSWVYPEDRETGFKEYYPAVDILKYFIDKIGPYPNSKLANVQSKTRYGGMENAGNIFYYEGSINGQVDNNNLIAHEIAHQWFGNSASELNWHHVWLSEGFATYMTNVYIEDHHGSDSLRHTMVRQRDQVIKFFEKIPAAIIDTTITEYARVLSPNTYQKAAWFLHMLRRKVGDESFWEGIKTYYRRFAFGNAMTADFLNIMEQISGQDLDRFFEQWLFQPGHPLIEVTYEQVKNKLHILVNQVQTDSEFAFPLEISFRNKKGLQNRTIQVTGRSTRAVVKAKGAITEFKIDPQVNLLHAVDP